MRILWAQGVLVHQGQVVMARQVEQEQVEVEVQTRLGVMQVEQGEQVRQETRIIL